MRTTFEHEKRLTLPPGGGDRFIRPMGEISSVWPNPGERISGKCKDNLDLTLATGTISGAAFIPQKNKRRIHDHTEISKKLKGSYKMKIKT
jgi:hypothetical protein